MLMLNVKTNKLIENIFLFDKVFVDIAELPVVVNCLNSADENCSYEIFKKGMVSYIDSPEVVVGCSRKPYFSTLAYSAGKRIPVDRVEDLENHLFSHFAKGVLTSECLEGMIESSLYCRKDYGKDLVDSIGKDIDSGIIKSGLNLKTTKSYTIFNDDVHKINAYSEASRGLYLADQLGINNVFLDDIIKDVTTLQEIHPHDEIEHSSEKASTRDS